MTEIEFKALAAQGYNRIPLIKETYADLDTTLGIYLKLAHSGSQAGHLSCLLESVVGGEQSGRYSFIGLPAQTVIKNWGQYTEVIRNGQTVETHEGNPFAFIQAYQQRFKVATRPGIPRFAGGLAGYFAYDSVRHLHADRPLSDKPLPPGQEGMPDIVLMHIDEMVIVDNVIGRTYLLVYADPAQEEAYSRAKKRLLDLRVLLRKPVDIPYSLPSLVTDPMRYVEKAEFVAKVQQVKAQMAQGDVSQLHLAQFTVQPFRDAPLSLYRALRSAHPSPYMHYWNLGDFHVLGSSPRTPLCQVSAYEASTPPATGLAAQGSQDNIERLCQALAPTALTGEPTLSAMQLIDAVEPMRRGLYGGAVGYLSYNGSMAFVPAVCTAVLRNGMLYAPSGAHIQSDTDPDQAWEDSEQHARVLLRAAEQVQYGLDQAI